MVIGRHRGLRKVFDLLFYWGVDPSARPRPALRWSDWRLRDAGLMKCPTIAGDEHQPEQPVPVPATPARRGRTVRSEPMVTNEAPVPVAAATRWRWTDARRCAVSRCRIVSDARGPTGRGGVRSRGGHADVSARVGLVRAPGCSNKESRSRDASEEGPDRGHGASGRSNHGSDREDPVDQGRQERVTETKLYPGYVFVEMSLESDGRIPRTCSSSSRRPPASATSSAPRGVLRRCLPVKWRRCSSTRGSPTRKPTVEMEFESGDAVTIKEGPFENYEGTVDEVLPDKGLVRVLVTIFGRQAPVELEYSRSPRPRNSPAAYRLAFNRNRPGRRPARRGCYPLSSMSPGDDSMLSIVFSALALGADPSVMALPVLSFRMQPRTRSHRLPNRRPMGRLHPSMWHPPV